MNGTPFETAVKICWKHGASMHDMVDALGYREVYSLRDLLNWLGY